MNSFEDRLTESSLTRILKKVTDSECATISAFRGEYTTAENKARSKEMAAALSKLGYSFTQIVGNYEEAASKGKEKKTDKELSFFVQNINDDDKFKDNLKKLSIKFEQDSVLLIPKGGKGAYLIGTRKAKNKEEEADQFIKYNEKVTVGDISLANIKTQYFSKVGGRGFEFRSLSESINAEPMTINERFLRDKLGTTIIESLKDIQI